MTAAGPPPEAPGLAKAGTYEREVSASLARVWENVFDWEHLPSLHSASFATVELLEEWDSGWRVKLSNQPAARSSPQVIRLTTDRAAGEYVVTTEEGAGAGSQVHTRLDALAPHRTLVRVDFFVAEHRPDRLSAIGARYVEVYARLWDEDEDMMVAREAALSPRAPAAAAPVALGSLEALRDRLPLTVGFGSGRFRLAELDGEIVVYSLTCPHWLAPLDDAPVVAGVVRCPWHGYRFDVRTGCSANGRTLRLAEAPRVCVADGEAFLQPATKG